MIPRSLKRFVPRPVLRAYEHELAKETHINRALAAFGGQATYMEIGVRDGDCIRQIRAARKIAVDPAPVGPERITSDGTELHALTSDDFFAGAAPAELPPESVHVALVDGLHEFHQALRDVLNLEPYMARGGTIFIHDCNPPTQRHAENPNGPWNGDVWKVPYFLRRFRPDLECHTLDCDWGLGIVTGFSGRSFTPRPADVEMTAALGYAVLAADRKNVLGLRSPLSRTRVFRMAMFRGA